MTIIPFPPFPEDRDRFGRDTDPGTSDRRSSEEQEEAWNHAKGLFLCTHIDRASQPGYDGFTQTEIKNICGSIGECPWHRYGDLFREHGFLTPHYICPHCQTVMEGEIDPNDSHRGRSNSAPMRPLLTHVPPDRDLNDNPCPTCGFNIDWQNGYVKRRWTGDDTPTKRSTKHKPQRVLFLNQAGKMAAEIFRRTGKLPKRIDLAPVPELPPELPPPPKHPGQAQTDDLKRKILGIDPDHRE